MGKAVWENENYSASNYQNQKPALWEQLQPEWKQFWECEQEHTLQNQCMMKS